MPEEIKKSVDLDTSGPEVDVSIEEVKEEADEHEFFYKTTDHETIVEESKRRKNGSRKTGRSIRRLW